MKLSQILFKLYKDGQNNIKTSGTLLHPMTEYITLCLYMHACTNCSTAL